MITCILKSKLKSFGGFGDNVWYLKIVNYLNKVQIVNYLYFKAAKIRIKMRTSRKPGKKKKSNTSLKIFEKVK